MKKVVVSIKIDEDWTEQIECADMETALFLLNKALEIGKEAEITTYMLPKAAYNPLTSLYFILLAFIMTACGDISQLESEAKAQATATPTASPTATPTSQVDVQVSQYGQAEPVTVTVGATTSSDAQNNCQYAVMDRETAAWPWNFVAGYATDEDAANGAQELVNQGFYPWNVEVVPPSDECK